MFLNAIRLRLIAGTGLMLALAGCATGPAFDKPVVAPASQAQVYLYRPWQFPGGAASLKLFVDGAPTELTPPNRSWQRVVLAPGSHAFGLTEYLNTFSCGGARVDVQAGQTVYLAVDFTLTGTGTVNHLSCVLVPRDEAQALKDMAGLPLSK